MSFTFRAAVTVIASGASPRTVNNPGLAGDVIFAQVSSSGADVTPTVPAGFNEVVAARNTSVPTVRIYWKMEGASPPATYSFTFPSGSGHSVSLMAFSLGAGNTVEPDAATIAVNAAGNRIFGSVVASVVNTLLTCFAALGNTGSVPPAGMTERWDDGSSPRIWSGTELIAAAGATGTRTATGTAAANNTATVVWKEVAGATLTPPSDLTATAISATSIDLDFTTLASGHDGHRVERSPAGAGTWAEIGSVAAGVNAYHDVGLDPSTAYDYRIRAYLGAVFGDYSSTASATTPAALTAPTAFTAQSNGAHAIDLAWESADDPVDFDLFSVERSASPDSGFAEIATVASNVYAYQDTSLAAGSTWHYRVRGVIA